MILGDSILQTASIARCVSVAITATDHIIFNPEAQAEQRQKPRLRARAAIRSSNRKLALACADGPPVYKRLLANLGYALPAGPVPPMEFHEAHRAVDGFFLRL